MKLKNVLIVVKDIEKSKQFYKELFGLDVIMESDGNVILTEGLVLQEKSVWEDAIERNVQPQNNATLLYFEETDMDGFLNRLSSYSEQIQYVNPPMEFLWGQRMVRFYDLDGNLIEVRTPN
ncbi:MAG: glyoxalase [Lachnospiraceae bacterium]|nr:glyoxalase [Lachnospiraceae bacterium]